MIVITVVLLLRVCSRFCQFDYDYYYDDYDNDENSPLSCFLFFCLKKKKNLSLFGCTSV